MGFKKMMKFVNKQAKKQSVWDLSVLKIYAFAFGLIVGAYFADFIKQYVWYVVAVIVITFVILIKRFWLKK